MSFEVGQKVAGKVTGITHFGAFVSLPDNKTGLIHISEISDSYIKDINTVLTVGQEVEIKVLTIAADGKISLSLRQANSDAQPETGSRPKPAFNKDSDRKYNKPPQTDNAGRFNKSSAGQSRSTFTPNQNNSPKKEGDFDSLMSGFLKDSEDRLTSLKRNTEGKRGGRGGRRS